MNNLLIIGGVAAGATAAARARRMDPDLNITILEAGVDVSFANCGLPYYIAGDIKSRSQLILQSPESFHSQYNVKVETLTEAIEINRDAKMVKALHKASGEEREYPYDKLILAQGGKPFIPGMAGVEKDHVFSLWTLDDMDKIDSFITGKSPRKAVVVGGGFIGLEMVEALTKRGMEVSVIEMASHVMPLLEPEIAASIQEEMEARSAHLYAGKAVTAIKDRSVTLNDGSEVEADMVLLSVGVRPTLKLAQDAGLELGPSGGLLVDQNLRTSDASIFAGGDMAEINHKVLNKTVRIPLAGPANRQGRIAANNAISDKTMAYRGSQGTSIVRFFDTVAGSTGVTIKQAEEAGLNPETIVIRKENHVGYYPGGKMMTIMLIYQKESGKLLGAQVSGEAGVDRRLDVLATAIYAKLTVADLSELDLAYAPPFGSANDPVNIAGFAAQNRMSGYSPVVTAAELEKSIGNEGVILLDIRDVFTFRKGHVEGSVNLAAEQVNEKLSSTDKSTPIFVCDDTGKVAHRLARSLILAGFENVKYISGGYQSLERYQRAEGFNFLAINMTPVEKKSIDEEERTVQEETVMEKETAESTGTLVVDVRSPEEYRMGAYPGAVNVPLDEITNRIEELGDKDRELILYCASGARSAYGLRLLKQSGFTNLTNGGGLMQMMAQAV
ncbi:MAG: FAD-dependent oxidoreductase [Spirochaetales bacterium]|nr:FAD-dependent oxidoreductase [Spirochaetales bacterium]